MCAPVCGRHFFKSVLQSVCDVAYAGCDVGISKGSVLNNIGLPSSPKNCFSLDALLKCDVFNSLVSPIRASGFKRKEHDPTRRVSRASKAAWTVVDGGSWTPFCISLTLSRAITTDTLSRSLGSLTLLSHTPTTSKPSINLCNSFAISLANCSSTVLAATRISCEVGAVGHHRRSFPLVPCDASLPPSGLPEFSV